MVKRKRKYYTRSEGMFVKRATGRNFRARETKKKKPKFGFRAWRNKQVRVGVLAKRKRKR